MIDHPDNLLFLLIKVILITLLFRGVFGLCAFVADWIECRNRRR